MINTRLLGVGLLLAALSTWIISLASAEPLSAPPPRPIVLPEAQEIALALEAAPREMQAGVGLWVLTDEGYRQIRAATNGYTCIVNRDDVEAIKPTCYDEEGTESILPAVVWFGDQLMAGRQVAAIRADLTAAFETGRFHAPRRPGLAFMLSPHIVNVMTMPDGRRVRNSFPPHYMIYAPNLTNEDLGLTADDYAANPWLPFVAYEGPHGFLIIRVPPD
jgi:hypothetical protein